jgi:hypothetical protein
VFSTGLELPNSMSTLDSGTFVLKKIRYSAYDYW